MPTPTLISTPGSASANSYASVAEGDTYHDSRLDSTDWSGASTANKTIALIMATRLLDEMFDWTGYVVNSTQVLLWPRVGMWYESLYYVPSDIIPAQLRDATCEYARQLLVSDRTADNDVEAQGLKSMSVGSISMSFKDTIIPKVVPDAVAFLIPRSWGRIRSRYSNTVKLARV